MEPTELRYILQELQFSAELPEETLDQLAGESSLQRASAGEMIFREGASNDNLYLLRSGRVALEVNVPSRGNVRILTIGPGEMIGWSSLLGEGRMTASAVVMDAAELIVAPVGKLRELCDHNRDFGYHLMQRMAAALSKRLVATRLQLLDLFGSEPLPVPANSADTPAKVSPGGSS